MLGNRSTYRFGHCFMQWWEKYHVAHPEYFAKLEPGMQQPYPQPDRVKLCVSTPAVADQIIEEWKDAGMPDNWCVCPNDGGGFCTCENCRSLDHAALDGSSDFDSGNLTGRYVALWNTLLKRMKALNPNVTLSGYAYSAYREPLPGTKLEDGMILGIVHTYSSYDQWGKWHDAGAKLFLRPNWWHMGAVAPHIPLHRAGNYFRYAYANSMIGFYFDSLMGYWGTQGPYYYLIARLSVRPELTVDEVIDEYASAFGQAAPSIKKYIEYWETFTEQAAYTIPAGGSVSQNSNGLYEQAVRAHNLPIHPLQGGWRVLPYLYTDDVLKKANDILDEASLSAGKENNLVRERIRFLQDGLVFLRMTRDVVSLVWADSFPDGMTQKDVVGKIRALQAFGEEIGPRNVVWINSVMNTMKNRGILTKEWQNLDGL